MSTIDEVLVGVTSLGFDTAPLIYFVQKGIVSWFTEGFDTKDLQEAKALIEKLNH